MEERSSSKRGVTPDHPPYSEMVQVALRALSEKKGSTMASISSFILSNYPNLPWAHSRFLPYYLRKLILSREVSVISSPSSPTPRFALPNTAASNPNPPRRGRGRPRKTLSPSEAPPVPTTARRGRGRPRKNQDRESTTVPTSRPKLILHLKRRNGGDGHAGGGWLCCCTPVHGESVLKAPPPPPTVPDAESFHRSTSELHMLHPSESIQ